MAEESGTMLCDICKKPTNDAYEVNGYLGVHLECSSCFNFEDDDLEEDDK